MTDPEKKSGEQKDSAPGLELRTTVSGAVENAEELVTNRKRLPWLIGGIVILLVLGLGVWAGVRTGTGTGGDGDDGGIFGQLPLSGERPASERVSPYSGRRDCPDIERRAIAVMMPSDPVVRPVSGFSRADMVWELPVLVSDVTRLMAIYQCEEPSEIGSVRSARHDYLFLAEGLDAILAHWGGSYHALNRVSAGEFQTINAIANPFNAFYRKSTIPRPHNGFTDYPRLREALEEVRVSHSV